MKALTDPMREVIDERRRVALREYLRANLFDGIEDGVLTAPIPQFLDDLTEVVEDFVADAANFRAALQSEHARLVLVIDAALIGMTEAHGRLPRADCPICELVFEDTEDVG